MMKQDKECFVQKTEEQLIKELKKFAKSLKNTCTHYTDSETLKKFSNVIKELETLCGAHIRIELGVGEVFDCFYPSKIFYKGVCIDLTK